MSKIILTKEQRKKIEKIVGLKIKKSGIYKKKFGEGKWLVTLDSGEKDTTAAEYDKKGADVCVCSYEKEEYIDEKCVYDATLAHHSFKIGAGAATFEPRGFFWSGCITTYYCCYTLNSRKPLNLINSVEDIISVELVIIERRKIEEELQRIMQLTKAEMLTRAKQLRNSRHQSSLFRQGIKMRHKKTRRRNDDNSVYIDVPKEIIDNIALYKGVIT